MNVTTIFYIVAAVLVIGFIFTLIKKIAKAAVIIAVIIFILGGCGISVNQIKKIII